MHHRIMSRLHAIPHQLAPKPGEDPELVASKEGNEHEDDKAEYLEGFQEVGLLGDGLGLGHAIRISLETGTYKTYNQ